MCILLTAPVGGGNSDSVGVVSVLVRNHRRKRLVTVPAILLIRGRTQAELILVIICLSCPNLLLQLVVGNGCRN